MSLNELSTCTHSELRALQDIRLAISLFSSNLLGCSFQKLQSAEVIIPRSSANVLQQKCVNYLWRGWLVQDEDDPSRFIEYKQKSDTRYWTHVDPDRMRAPVYQNATQVVFSLIYLGLYTGAINTVNRTGDLDVVEVILYIFTFGFLCDEFSKFWKVGRFYIGFWNVFNLILYALLTTSLVIRFMALGHPLGGEGKRGPREDLNELSYNFLGKFCLKPTGFPNTDCNSFLGAYVLDATSAVSRFNPLLRCYASGAESHDERITHLLCPAHRHHNRFLASFRWYG